MSDRPSWLRQTLDLALDVLPALITIVVAAGLVVRQQLSPMPVPTNDLLSGVLAVVGLLAISEIVERYRWLRGIKSSTQEVIHLTRNRFPDHPSALAYFTEFPDLQALIQQSNKIDLCGVCLTSTIHTHFGSIRKQLKAGATIRVLVIAPNSGAVEMAGFRSETGDARYYQGRLEATFQDLEFLHRSLSGFNPVVSGQLQVGLLEYPPSFGICAFDADRSQGVVFVEIYPHKSVRKSPILELRFDRDGKWYDYFSDQFDRMWDDATIWDPSSGPVAGAAADGTAGRADI